MSLADEFAQIMNGGAYARSGFLDRNRDRILAALRGFQAYEVVRTTDPYENARIAAIVRNPTDEQKEIIGTPQPRPFIRASVPHQYRLHGHDACVAILDLAKNGADNAGE